MKLVFATNNKNKAYEIQQLLPPDFQILTLSEIGITEDIPETEETLEGNALLKARYVKEKTGFNCFADDTGLEVDALNGRPGVRSARYAGEQKNSEDNMNKVLTELHNRSDRSAQFRTSIALILGDKEYIFEGIVKGEILKEKIGEFGFGYDPIFEPENQGRSFAEMNMAEKNQLSHRARAFTLLLDHLKKLASDSRLT